MISVEEAEKIIQSCKRSYGTISLPLVQAAGHVLAEPLLADRDLPPFNRVAMDGIAIRFEDYENQLRRFSVAAVVGAGEAAPKELTKGQCYEIMTGAALPESADTVIPYEHLKLENNTAEIILEKSKKGQNIHYQGSDKKQGDLLIPVGTRLGAVEISVAASIGKTHVLVNKAPRIAIFSSGNELVDVHETPLPYQIRRSNNYLIQTSLLNYGLEATMMHLPDDLAMISSFLEKALQDFDVLLLSGGISMGKFDYIPKALENLGVQQHFHKVKQRPGKPFWFGALDKKAVVFALPGNPVSTYLCLQRYVLPWLEKTLGFAPKPALWASLDQDINFEAPLQYFMQVKLSIDAQANWRATPQKNMGSGDYASLLQADGFMELPMEKSTFQQGEVYRVWPYR